MTDTTPIAAICYATIITLCFCNIASVTVIATATMILFFDNLNHDTDDPTSARFR